MGVIFSVRRQKVNRICKKIFSMLNGDKVYGENQIEWGRESVGIYWGVGCNFKQYGK